MKVRYIIEVITTGRPPVAEVELTAKDIENLPGAKLVDKGVSEGHGFLEVVYNAPITKQLEFAARFLPTIFEVESKIDDVTAKNYWETIMKISKILSMVRRVAPNEKIEQTKKKLTRKEYEELILDDRKVSIIVALPKHSDPSLYFKNSIVLSEREQDGIVAYELVGDLADFTEAVLTTPPLALLPKEPLTYDLRIDEFQEILQRVTEFSRLVISNMVKSAMSKKK